MGLSRNGDDAAFTGLLSTKTELALGSWFPPAIRMEEPYSGCLGGTLLMLIVDAVRLLRNGSDTDA